MFKNILKSMSLLVLCSTVYAQGWQAVDFPTEERISGIFFLDPDTGFVVTGEGNFVRTDDAGKTWQSYSVKAGKSLEDLFFFNSDSGFVCGMNGALLATYNGGRHWNDMTLPDTLSWFFDIEMFDRHRGMVIGISRTAENPMTGVALHTADGGKSWQKMKAMGMGYSEILYFPGGMAYFLSFGKIHYSSDKGKSWKDRYTHQGNPARTLSMFDRSAILAGPKGLIYYSDDAGYSWTASPQSEEKVFVASAMTTEKDGYVGGINTHILKTSDGGKTWKPELAAKSFDILDMYVIENYLWAAGQDGGIMYKKLK